MWRSREMDSWAAMVSCGHRGQESHNSAQKKQVGRDLMRSPQTHSKDSAPIHALQVKKVKNFSPEPEFLHYRTHGTIT